MHRLNVELLTRGLDIVKIIHGIEMKVQAYKVGVYTTQPANLSCPVSFGSSFTLTKKTRQKVYKTRTKLTKISSMG